MTGIVFAVLSTALLLWTLVAIIYIRRSGRARLAADYAGHQADLLNQALTVHREQPVFLWPDGRLWCPEATRVRLAEAGPAFGDAQAETNPVARSPAPQDVRQLPPPLARAARQVLDAQGNRNSAASHTGSLASLCGPFTEYRIDPLSPLTGPADRASDEPSHILWLVAGNDKAASGRTDTPAPARRYPLTEPEATGTLSVFEASPMPMYIVSRDLYIHDTNRAYREAVDCPERREVLSRQVALLDPADIKAAVHNALDNAAPVSERLTAIVASQRCNLAVTITPIEADRALILCVDMTGEEEALAELTRVLDAQSETLDRLGSPVAIFGANKTLRFFNRIFAKFTGLGEDELDGIDHGRLLEAMYERRRLPEQGNFQDWKREALAKYTDLMEPEEELWFLADGTSHRVVTQPYPFGGLLLLIEDVTDRLELERSYNTLVEVQRKSLDNMLEGVAVFQEDGTLSLYNAAFAELWGVEPAVLDESPKAADLVQILPLQADLPYEQGEQLRSELGGWISERRVVTGRWVRGGERIIDYRLAPLPDGGAMLTQTDVTDSARVEQALRERGQALEAADRIRDEFIASMSYELRTPLNSIIGFSELLSLGIAGTLNDRQASYIRDILSSAGLLKDMISDVLDLAAIEAGNVALSFEVLDTGELLNSARPLIEELAARKNLKLSFTSSGLGHIAGDHRRLRQAIYNLFSTLVAMLPQKGALNFRAYGDAERVFMQIQTDQCSIAGQSRDQLIHMLRRGYLPSSQRKSGLNLALTRSIVTLHDGDLEVDPDGETGLKIRLSLLRTPRQSMIDA